MDISRYLSRTVEFAPPGRSAEIALLLACCQVKDQQTAISALSQQPLDWTYVLKLATEHRVIPLLHSQLYRLASTPAAIRTALDQQFKANAFANLASTRELLRLLSLFQAQAIPVLSFKGPTLTQMAYGDLGLRQFVDLDLIIPPAQIERAKHLLIAQGYQPQLNLSPAQQAFYANCFYALSFVHPQTRQPIDLHWALLRPRFSFSAPANFLWQQPATQLLMAGRPVPTFSPECLLLFLCAHSAKDNWQELRCVCDIAHLLHRQPNLDWEWMANHRGQLGAERMLAVGLALATQMLGAKVPADILERVNADSTVTSLVKQIQVHFWQERPVGSVAAHFDWPEFYLKTMETKQDRFWFCWDAIFTPTRAELELLLLPSALLWLYYPLRLGRLAAKYCRRGLRA
jgi:hypothetical protein